MLAGAKDNSAAKITESKVIGTSSWRLEKPTEVSNFNNHLHFSENILAQKHIDLAFEEIKSERIARLAGLVGHFAYWCTFGQINQMPLDDYHLKQLFISIA